MGKVAHLNLFPSLAGQFRTASDQRYTVLELPYLGHSLSLQVVQPSERKTPLSSLDSQLTARQLVSWNTGLRRTKMDIFLPRWRSLQKGVTLLILDGDDVQTLFVWYLQVQNAEQV